MLPEDVNQEIETLVRSGFYDGNHLHQILSEELYAPGELPEIELKEAIKHAFAKLNKEKESWEDVTDCDRLDKAFSALSSRGVIAMQNAGYTNSDGYDDFLTAYENSPDKSSVRGYCYYHGQDLERAVKGGGLFLAFGPVNPAEENSVGPEVGRIVQEEMERAGLAVKWDGTFATRILIPGIDWKRR